LTQRLIKMNIIQIIPGSGGSFYCGNCMRDSKYIDALRKQGHDVIKIPMYLPLFSDERDLSDVPVFYGAVSIYLKQLYPIFRKAPKWVDSMLNSKPLLKMASSMAGSTNAKGLEDMTVSMLLGEDGRQKEELDQMIDWIEGNYKPDIVHISNALLLGLAHRIKSRLNVRVVCSLQDEDVWVDAMDKGYQDKVWNLMSEKSADVDAFIAVSDFFAGVMLDRMKLPPEKIHTLHLGVNPANYEHVPFNRRPRNIGYLSRMCHENGFDILVDAFIGLKKKPGFEDVRLITTGGSTGADSKYLKDVKKKLAKEKLDDQVEFHEDFEGQGRLEFLKKVALISVPVRNGEAFGMYLLESMASGVPVVQPSLGAFPEIISLSKGGITYQPNTPEELSKNLAHVLSDPNRMEQLSSDALQGIETKFNILDQAKAMVEIYSKILAE
jgi:glycosyltransferase involved in cell wall biosynthesis